MYVIEAFNKGTKPYTFKNQISNGKLRRESPFAKKPAGMLSSRSAFLSQSSEGKQDEKRMMTAEKPHQNTCHLFRVPLSKGTSGTFDSWNPTRRLVKRVNSGVFCKIVCFDIYGLKYSWHHKNTSKILSLARNSINLNQP